MENKMDNTTRNLLHKTHFDLDIPYSTKYKMRKPNFHYIGLGDEVIEYRTGFRGIVVRDYYSGAVDIAKSKDSLIMDRRYCYKSELIKL